MSTTTPRPGARHRRKRLGCGESSGHGKTSGKGHKGQKARSGGSLRLGFEGGQMPLIRRIPKRGFNNAVFAIRYATVNLDGLDVFSDGAKVDEAILRSHGLVKGDWEGVKILGGGKLKPKNLILEVHAASASAKTALEAAGAKITLLKK
ncbi:MAG: 50S ribosomal protein L15 [Verrucomicrobia bacterium]|nr:50S ribosomal protein L15 [Verrucomicrobiota bacterium]